MHASERDHDDPVHTIAQNILGKSRPIRLFMRRDRLREPDDHPQSHLSGDDADNHAKPAKPSKAKKSGTCTWKSEQQRIFRRFDKQSL